MVLVAGTTALTAAALLPDLHLALLGVAAAAAGASAALDFAVSALSAAVPEQARPCRGLASPRSALSGAQGKDWAFCMSLLLYGPARIPPPKKGAAGKPTVCCLLAILPLCKT